MSMSNPNRSNKQVLYHFHVSGACQYLHTEDEGVPKGANAVFYTILVVLEAGNISTQLKSGGL